MNNENIIVSLDAFSPDTPADVLMDVLQMDRESNGTRRVVVLVNDEDRDKGELISSAVETLRGSGIIPFVQIGGVEMYAIEWQLQYLRAGYPQELTEVSRDTLCQRITEIAYYKHLHDRERNKLLSVVEEYTDGLVLPVDLQAQLNENERNRKRAQQTAQTRELLASAEALMSNGDTAGALNKMCEARTLQGIDREADWARLIAPKTQEQMLQGYKDRVAGISSGIYFSKPNKDAEEWEIPIGALSYVCAPTSHGKSRLLQNIALRLMLNDRDGGVLYVSLEEDSLAVNERLLNIYTAIVDARESGVRDVYKAGNLSVNNTKTIHTYLSSGENYSTHDKLELLPKAAEELFEYESTGRLRVVSERECSDLQEVAELDGFIRYAAKTLNPQAVIVDYIQLLHSKAVRGDKKAEMADVCERLMACSVETQLPIIIGAQLNRQGGSPLDLDVQQIADASNIEHSANTVLLLWDSVQPTQAGKDANWQNDYQGKNYLEGLGFSLDSPQRTQFVRLAKCRQMERNSVAVLKYNGNTFRVQSNKSASTMMDDDLY
jgi:hypothetical protein